MSNHKLTCCNCSFDVIFSQVEYDGLNIDSISNCRIYPICSCELEEA